VLQIGEQRRRPVRRAGAAARQAGVEAGVAHQAVGAAVVGVAVTARGVTLTGAGRGGKVVELALSAKELADALHQFIDRPSRLTELAANIAPVKTIGVSSTR